VADDACSPTSACAIALNNRAIAIYESRPGLTIPRDRLESLSGLAVILCRQGGLADARLLYGRALAIYEARLVPDHPDTVRGRQERARVVSELVNRR
jgi:Flp pilus assembly protein TadD